MCSVQLRTGLFHSQLGVGQHMWLRMVTEGTIVLEGLKLLLRPDGIPAKVLTSTASPPTSIRPLWLISNHQPSEPNHLVVNGHGAEHHSAAASGPKLGRSPFTYGDKWRTGNGEACLPQHHRSTPATFPAHPLRSSTRQLNPHASQRCVNILTRCWISSWWLIQLLFTSLARIQEVISSKNTINHCNLQPETGSSNK